MVDNQNGGQEPATEVAKPSMNWAALSTESVVEVQKPVTQEPAKTDTTQTTEVKTTEDKSAASTSVDAKLPDIKDDKVVDKPVTTDTQDTTKDEFKLDASLIKDAPKAYEQDTFQALAQDLGFQLEKESFEDFQKTFKENFVPKAEVEKLTTINKENLLTTFKPEVAAAIQLKELGIPEEFIFNPTAQHDQLLQLNDVELLRLKYENQPNWTPEMVDAKMEEIVTDGKAGTLASIERATLKTEREDILKTRSQLVQQHTEKQQQALAQQKVESDTKFLDTLSKADKFLGLPVTKDAKDVIAAKYKSGAYDKVLNEPQNKMLAIMYLEYGTHLAEQLRTRSKAEGVAEVVRNMADVPNNKALGGGRVQEQGAKTNNWSALKE